MREQVPSRFLSQARRDELVARWRRVLIAADLLSMAVLVGAGHLQADAGRIRLLTPPTVDTWLGAPTVVALAMAAAAFWMAAPGTPGSGGRGRGG